MGRARRAGSAREDRRLREHDRAGGRVGQREVARQLRRRAMGGAEERRCDRGRDVSQPSSACRHDFGCCSQCGSGRGGAATSPTDSRSRRSRASGAGGAGRVHHGYAQGRRKAPRGQRPHDRRAGATDRRQEAAAALSAGGHPARPGGREARRDRLRERHRHLRRVGPAAEDRIRRHVSAPRSRRHRPRRSTATASTTAPWTTRRAWRR